VRSISPTTPKQVEQPERTSISFTCSACSELTDRVYGEKRSVWAGLLELRYRGENSVGDAGKEWLLGPPEMGIPMAVMGMFDMPGLFCVEE